MSMMQREENMRALLLILMGATLLATGCSPHRGWGGGGYCEVQQYNTYPTQLFGSGQKIQVLSV